MTQHGCVMCASSSKKEAVNDVSHGHRRYIMTSIVYVATATGHYDDCRHAETRSFLSGIFKEEDRALSLATEGQLEYIKSRFASDNDDPEYPTVQQEISDIRSMQHPEREGEDTPGEASLRLQAARAKFDASIKLLDKLLPVPEYTQHPTQCRYKVFKMELGHSYEDSRELCLFPPPLPRRLADF